MNASDPFFEYISREKDAITKSLYKQARPFKDYSRFPQVPLTRGTIDGLLMHSALLSRKSADSFSSEEMSFDMFGTLLFWSAGLSNQEGLKQRPYPSGGGKYPLEVYPLVLNVVGVEPGVYHYNVEHHALERLIFANSEALMELLRPKGPFINQASVIFLITFIKQRSFEKYGALSYKLALLEGGHLGQNLYLVASGLGIGTRAIGEIDQLCNKELALDGMNESVVYTIAHGMPPRA